MKKYQINTQYLFFSLRHVFLASAIVFTIIWIYFGFDSTLEGLFDPALQGIGFHWSTFQTMALSSYILMINFDVNGLTSLNQLAYEIQEDLLGFIHPWVAREISANQKHLVNPLTALVYSGCISVGALFVFELPYIFLFNYFQFNSLMWPFYFWQTNFFGQSKEFIRNVGLSILPFFLAWWILYFPKKLSFTVRKKWVLILLSLTLSTWIIWIMIPASVAVQTPASMNLPSGDWLFPKQHLFPQTIYDYYLNATVNQPYESINQNGWHQNDPPVHLINIVTKYMIFVTITYICCVLFRKKEVE